MDSPLDLFLDSDDAVNVELSDYRSRPNFVFKPPLTNLTAVGLQAAQIPYTFYYIDLSNNVFMVTYPTPTYLAIPFGSYTPTSLAATIQVILQTVSIGYHCYVDPTSGYFVIYHTAQPFSVICDHPSRSMHAVLGFDFGKTYESVNGLLYPEGITGSSITKDYVVADRAFRASSQPLYLYLHCPELAALANGNIRRGGTLSDVIAILPVNNTPYQDIITYRNESPAMYPFTSNTITHLSFYLTVDGKNTFNTNLNDVDQRDNYLSLRGSPFQIQLRFTSQLALGGKLSK